MVTSKSNITTFVRFSLLDKLKLLFGSHLRIETSIELLANVEVAGLNAHSTTHVESTSGVFVRHPFPPFGYSAVLPEDSHRAPRSASEQVPGDPLGEALNDLDSESLVFDSPNAAELRHKLKSESSHDAPEDPRPKRAVAVAGWVGDKDYVVGIDPALDDAEAAGLSRSPYLLDDDEGIVVRRNLPSQSLPDPPFVEGGELEGFSLDDAVRVMRQNKAVKQRKRLLSAFAMQRDRRTPDSASAPAVVPERHSATPVLFYPAHRFWEAFRYLSASKALLVFSRDGGGPYSCKLIDIAGPISTEPPVGFAAHSFVMFSSSGLALIDRHDPDLVKPPLPVYEGHCVLGADGFLIGEVLDGAWLLELRLGAGGKRIDWENRLCIPI